MHKKLSHSTHLKIYLNHHKKEIKNFFKRKKTKKIHLKNHFVNKKSQMKCFLKKW